MTTQPTPENGGPAAPTPYGAPAVPMSKKELKAQKRMQKASRGWLARHKVLTGVLVLAGVGVVGSQLGGDEDASEAATPSVTSAPTASAEATAPDGDASAEATDGVEVADGAPADDAPAADAPAEEPADPQIGVPVQVGDLEVTVTEVETGIASVGDQYFGEQAQGQFVLVQLSMTNTGDRAETFVESNAVLVDTAGRQHDTSSASIYLDGTTSWLVTDINPGNTASGALLFDIPADAEVDLLQVSSGLFSSPEDVRLR
ncbi:DUF4352 domain-containing protein [Georgenia sp. Z1491]|uniref:DUF4352 domain-containing protein n=1 Tax=Georgenia sp. Z1491 TaxID=3416707 RepID=UPI003CE7E4A1